MSWLSQFAKHNRGFIGNALKNVSPFLALTPLGAAGSFVAGGLGRGIQKGANLGNIMKSAGSNALIGSSLNAGVGALKNAFVPSNAVPELAGGMPATPALANTSMGAAPTSGLGLGASPSIPSAYGAATPAAASSASPSLLDKVGTFADKHTNAIGMGLQGLGGIAQGQAMAKQADRQFEANAAQTDLERRKLAMEEDAYSRKKAQDEALEAQRQQIMQQLLRSFSTGGF